MDRAISVVNVSVMKGLLEANATDVQMVFMAFQIAEVGSDYEHYEKPLCLLKPP